MYLFFQIAYELLSQSRKLNKRRMGGWVEVTNKGGTIIGEPRVATRKTLIPETSSRCLTFILGIRRASFPVSKKVLK